MARQATNLEMEQGTNFSVLAKWSDTDGNPIDLTYYNARMEIRSSYASNTIAESLSTANGEISMTSTGDITLALSADRTSKIRVDYNQPSKPPRTAYVYDLEVTAPDGTVTRLLSGTINVFGEVTR